MSLVSWQVWKTLDYQDSSVHQLTCCHNEQHEWTKTRSTKPLSLFHTPDRGLGSGERRSVWFQVNVPFELLREVSPLA